MQLIPLLLRDFLQVPKVARRVEPAGEPVEFGGRKPSTQPVLLEPHTDEVKVVLVFVAKLGAFERETKELARQDLPNVREVALVASILVKNSSTDIACPVLYHSFRIVAGLVLPRTNPSDDLRNEAQRFLVERPAAYVPVDGEESSGLIGDPPAVVIEGESTHSISFDCTS